MNITDKICCACGKLRLAAYDNEGRELWQNSGKNLIVQAGYEALADCLTGNADAAISHVEIGTRGDAPILSDAAITDPVRIHAEITSRGPEGVRLDFTIGYSMANGMPIREFGIITKDGRLFSRRVRAAIEKTDAMTIVGQWDITF